MITNNSNHLTSEKPVFLPDREKQQGFRGLKHQPIESRRNSYLLNREV